MADKTPSKYQVAIYGEYEKTNNNIFINACPGSGKSYTVKQLAHKTPFYKKGVAVAFNKSIAEELKSKLPSNIESSTMHSLGFKILRKNLGGKFTVNEIKTFILGKKCLKNDESISELRKNNNKYSVYLFTIAKLYDLCRMNLEPPNIESLSSLADMYNVEVLDPQIYESSLKVIDYINNYNKGSHDNFMVDFTDMLWLPYILVDKRYYPKYDVGFYDEVQDANPLQRETFLRTIKPTGRFVAVGDEKQAIYSFMGSNLNSFNKLKGMPNTTTLPLSVSYRCPVKVVEFANEIFPGMEAFEGNIEGAVRKGSFNEIKEGDMVLCRNNQPLIESWIKLVGTNMESHILGRDFGKALQNLIKSVDSLQDLYDLLNRKRDILVEKGVKNPFKNKNYQALKEKIDIISLIMNERGYFFDDLVNLFDELFSDEINFENSIMLSTVHKAKGLECKRVFIIGYHSLMPSPYATSELERYQEQCTKYVAVTRSIEELVFIDY
jgi:DNA helicase-2/ATP-dependent DNA helicase PcrA